MSTANHFKRKARRLAEDVEERIDEAADEAEGLIEEAEGLPRWMPVLAVAGIAAVGLMLLMRGRKSRLERRAHHAVDQAFRLSSEAADSAREIADRSSRWLRKVPRVRIEMP